MTKQETVDEINRLLKENNLSITPRIMFSIEDAPIINAERLIQKANFNDVQEIQKEIQIAKEPIIENKTQEDILIVEPVQEEPTIKEPTQEETIIEEPVQEEPII